MTGRVFASAMAAAILWAGAAAAQQGGGESTCLSAQVDWNVCVFPPPPAAVEECWGVSKPKETVNTRDGQPASVRRGDILLFVTFRPGSGAAGEVTFTGGYPFAPGSTVSMDIGGRVFELPVDGEWAWPADPARDAEILAAMKAGAQAIVTARSARGTQTRDTFSLNGFTAAMTDAEARCK